MSESRPGNRGPRDARARPRPFGGIAPDYAGPVARRPRPGRPLPLRDGIDPVRTRLPADARGTVLDWMCGRFPHAAGALRRQCAEGLLVLADGTPVTPATPALPGIDVWGYRDLPEETPVPFDMPILHKDADIVVVDKPPFLATAPRGGRVAETALVRLRRELGDEHLAPAHRLDRLTSGVLLFTRRPEVRAAYQTPFAERRVGKIYEALAPLSPAVTPPVVRRSRIVKERGRLQAREMGGTPDAETLVESVVPVAGMPGIGRYTLRPTTGRTHQLRVHMAALGVPILGDPLYPTVWPDGPDDFTRPLALVARELRFLDPIGGDERGFVSRRALEALFGPPSD